MSKKTNTKNLTINEYTNFINRTYQAKLLKNADYYLKQYAYFADIAKALPCALYILDYTTQGYLFINEGCEKIIGYTSDECMTWKQQDFIRTCMHEEDAKIFTAQFFEKYMTKIQEIPKSDIKDCRISINYRFRRKDGVMIKVLQQNIILETTDTGYPVLSLGILTDITEHKQDNNMVFSITHYTKDTGFNTVSSTLFNEEMDCLTEREKEIIKHISFGHNTNQIADLLHISEFTVRAHRRNISKKTGSKNVAELINYALSNGIK